MVLEELI
jgi:hypothetical protein